MAIVIRIYLPEEKQELRCPQCTLIIREEGVCPFCEAVKITEKERKAEKYRRLKIWLDDLGSQHQKTCPERPFRGWHNCETCPETAVMRQIYEEVERNK